MVNGTQAIAKLIPTMMAVELIDDNLHNLKKKQNTKSITKQAIKNMVGVSLIGTTSGIVKGL